MPKRKAANHLTRLMQAGNVDSAMQELRRTNPLVPRRVLIRAKQLQQLEALAKQQGTSVSAVVRNLLAQALADESSKGVKQ